MNVEEFNQINIRRANRYVFQNGACKDRSCKGKWKEKRKILLKKQKKKKWEIYRGKTYRR